MSTPCFICETGIEELRVGPDLRPQPCTHCLSVIAETVREYDEDKLSEQEESENHQSLDDFLATKRKYDV
jgi:cytidine deaminase